MPKFIGSFDAEFALRYEDMKKGRIGLANVTNTPMANGDTEWRLVFSRGMSAPAPRIIAEIERIGRAIGSGSAVITRMDVIQMPARSVEYDFEIIEFSKTRVKIRNFPPLLGHTVAPSGASYAATPARFDFPNPMLKLPSGGTIIEPYVGYRDFDVLAKDDIYEPSLISRNGLLWNPYEPMIATCNGNIFAHHDAPDEECQCGIYAFDSPSHYDLKPNANIWGEVYLWGTVLVCESGYRAQYAYPKTIFVRDVGTELIKKFAQNLEKEYGVPVHLVETRTGMTAGEIMEKAINKLLDPPTDPKGGES